MYKSYRLVGGPYDGKILSKKSDNSLMKTLLIKIERDGVVYSGRYHFGVDHKGKLIANWIEEY